MYKPLTEWWKSQLVTLTESPAMKASKIKIDGVVLSKRLIDSPVLVVSSQFGYTASQEKILRAQGNQTKENPMFATMMGGKTLEINGNHPVVFDLLQKVKDNKEDKPTIDIAQTLFQTAMVESGYEIQDPSDLARRVYRLMSKQLGVDPDEPVKDIELPEEEEEAEEVQAGDEDSEVKEEETVEVKEEASADPLSSFLDSLSASVKGRALSSSEEANEDEKKEEL